MRLIAWKTLREFAERHPDALRPLKVWTKLIESRDYATPAELQQVFGGNVDFLKTGVVIFDIRGNNYRISANVRFTLQIVFIRHVMTHKEYDTRTKNGTL